MQFHVRVWIWTFLDIFTGIYFILSAAERQQLQAPPERELVRTAEQVRTWPVVGRWGFTSYVFGETQGG